MKPDIEIKGSRYFCLQRSSKLSINRIATTLRLSRSGIRTANASRLWESLRDICALKRNADQASDLFER